MPEIDVKVMEHCLAIDPKCRLVKEKIQQKAIIEEVDKLLKVGFIQKVSYPNWVSNVDLVKVNGK